MASPTPAACGIKMEPPELRNLLIKILGEFGYPISRSEALTERPDEAIRFVRVTRERLTQVGEEAAANLPDHVILHELGLARKRRPKPSRQLVTS